MKGSDYLATLKKRDLDVVEAKIQEASIMYKGIERLCGDPTLLWKKVEDYGGTVLPYLSLKKAASLCYHPTVVGQQKVACTEQVEPAQSYHVMVRTDLDALQERHRSVI